jgi:hypothetical protein
MTLGYGQWVSWASKPHNGIDYSSPLWNMVKSVGRGEVGAYTKPDAGRFGSISLDPLQPDGRGPAIWVRYTLASGEPVYVLYGHTADSWTDRSRWSGATFFFDCTYFVRGWGPVGSGETIGRTAPFYNGGQLAPHLHLSVFKPARASSGGYNLPPRIGWGYSDLRVPEGEYLDPEIFLMTYRLQP